MATTISASPTSSMPPSLAINRCVPALIAARPNVPNNGVSGSGISSAMLARTYWPLGSGIGHSVGGSASGAGSAPSGGSAVMGRA
jgi:hypothetical protein